MEVLLVAQLVRALPPGVCHTEHPCYESQFDHTLFISTFHIVLYQFTPSFCLISSKHRPLTDKDGTDRASQKEPFSLKKDIIEAYYLLLNGLEVYSPFHKEH